jgi:hypothetical protein
MMAKLYISPCHLMAIKQKESFMKSLFKIPINVSTLMVTMLVFGNACGRSIPRTHVSEEDFGEAGAQKSVLATFPDRPLRLALDSDNLYFSTAGDGLNGDSTGRIVKVNKKGGPLTVLAELPGNLDALALEVDDSHVYFVGYPGRGLVGKISKDGGSVETMVAPADRVLTLAINNGVAYTSGDYLFGVDLATGEQTVVGSFASANDLKADATSLYAIDNTNGLRRIEQDGSNPVTLAEEASGRSLAIDSQYVYYVESKYPNRGALKRQPKAGGPSYNLIDQDASLFFDFVTDGKAVYFTDQLYGTVSSVPVGGGPRTDLLKDVSEPSEIVLDDEAAYVVSGHSVLRVPL